MKSLALFYRQVNKALRIISHWLVNLLVTIFARRLIQHWSTRMLLYTSSIHSISNRGKWACSSRIGALPPGQKCIIAAARECLSAYDLSYISLNGPGTAWTVFKSWLLTTHVNLGLRWSYLAFQFLGIRMLLGKNGYDKARRFNFLGTFSFCIF